MQKGLIVSIPLFKVFCNTNHRICRLRPKVIPHILSYIVPSDVMNIVLISYSHDLTPTY